LTTTTTKHTLHQADDSEFLIAFPILLAFLGLILVILVSLLRKLEKGALEMEGVVVTVLTVAKLAVSIKYGLPLFLRSENI
jgi:hypothetical protein